MGDTKEYERNTFKGADGSEDVLLVIKNCKLQTLWICVKGLSIK